MELYNGYYISKSGSRDAEQSCAELGGTLAEITEENRIELTDLLRGGKYNVGGATVAGKCNFIDRRNNYSINKKCRKLKYICDVDPSARILEPECEIDLGADPLFENDYYIAHGETSYDSFTWHEARDECKKIGDSKGGKWDLVIFNSENEFNMINNYLNANCLR